LLWQPNSVLVGNEMNNHELLTYEETNGGIKVSYQNEIIGWICTSLNGTYTYIKIGCSESKPKVDSIDEAKSLLVIEIFGK